MGQIERSELGRKVFLNLGGGAARGFAHIGVLSCLREANISFDAIIGVSMGAIVGGVYALNPDVEFTREKIVALALSKRFQESAIGYWARRANETRKSFFDRAKSLYTNTNMVKRFFLSPGILDTPQIDTIINPYLADIALGSTRVPFYVVAVDLGSGMSRIFHGKDRMRDAVIASASMPMVFPPRQIDGKSFVDGGVLDKVGIDAAIDLGAHLIIAVDVSDEGLSELRIRSGMDVMIRTEDVTSLYRRQRQLRNADIVIQPIEGNYHWADYSKYREFIDMGYEATHKKLPAIRSKLRLLSLRRFFFIGGIASKRKKLRRFFNQ